VTIIASVPPAWLQEAADQPISPGVLEAGATLAGLRFGAAEVLQMQRAVAENAAGYARLQALGLPHELAAPLVFQPLLPGRSIAPAKLVLEPPVAPAVSRPADDEDLAFLSLAELSVLLRTRQLSSVELVRACIARCRRLDERLRFVVNLLEDQALGEAAALDAELQAGRWRGPLHGIPYGAKDLLAARGAPTTWGSALHEHRVIDADASVVERLRAAGAVLLAKTSLGEYAYGDLWHGGRTRNPWDPEQGSSGSSAGSAAAVACGALPFAIGSETLGSIVSPSATCGASGLRPTFGSVSRHGAMCLSFTMDKIGPIARGLDDCAIVHEVIRGPDGKDPSVVAAPFARGRAADLSRIVVGHPRGAFDEAPGHRHVLDQLRAMGAQVRPVDLDFGLPLGDLLVVLVVEAATQFDELTRSGDDDAMVWQDEAAWPNTFRAARLVPAVEYLRAQRLRTRVMQRMAEIFDEVDILVHPSFAGDLLLATNLSGHPAACLPDGLDARGLPRSITFTGPLHGESDLLAVAGAWQSRHGSLPRPPVR
jgi:Asp-tRNA(Asn)/Glu-tRNA(Gln) amidotransferase A subunit family amidase